MQDVFGPVLEPLLYKLQRRAERHRVNRLYYDGTLYDRNSQYSKVGIPRVINELRLKNSYRNLMSLATVPWGSLVVDSVQDRLEATSIKTGDKAADQALWEVWQANGMDAESKLGHSGALIDGRAYATVWPDANGYPEIVLDDSSQMVMSYRPGRHQSRHRVEALRYWCVGQDENRVEYATLYRPEGLYRFRSTDPGGHARSIEAGGSVWEEYMLPSDGSWPAPNPYGVVPVVEIATNRQLRAGPWPSARGEFEHGLGLIDQINLLTYLGLMVGIWMGFPMRGVTGLEIQRRVLKDDDGQILTDDQGKPRQGDPVAPFEVRPDSIVQATDPNANFFQLDAADRKNLMVFSELQQLAMLTKTPRHYFPNDGGLSNISADTIRADEGALGAKVKGIHKPFIGEGWEEVLRVAGLMLDEPIEVPPTAELQWADHESRSLAEMADAATKISSIGFPWQIVASRYLNWTAEQVDQAESVMAGSSILQQLVEGAAQNGEQVNAEIGAADNGAP